MIVQPQPMGDELARYLKIIGDSASISCHLELLQWLQGDLQHFLPHDILLASWGNFEDGSVQHDIISSIPGVRSYAAGTDALPFLLSKLHSRWVAAARQPLTVDFAEFAPLLGSMSLPGTFSSAARSMESILVHGIEDKRSRHDCLYVMFRTSEMASRFPARSMELLMPHIDAALRQIKHLPQQHAPLPQPQPLTPAHAPAQTRPINEDASGLSERETQIMAWVAMGKTNSEIGTILNISGYTVKNHMQRIFQKLNVFNRTQAVSKVTRAIDV